MHINQVHEHSPLYEWYRILFPSQQCPIRKEDQLRNTLLSKGKKSTSESSQSATYISQTTQHTMVENFNISGGQYMCFDTFFPVGSNYIRSKLIQAYTEVP